VPESSDNLLKMVGVHRYWICYNKQHIFIFHVSACVFFLANIDF